MSAAMPPARSVPVGEGIELNVGHVGCYRELTEGNPSQADLPQRGVVEPKLPEGFC